jgi:hypothetical protein
MSDRDYQTRFVSTVRPDLSQPTHGFEEEDTLGGILFLRLKVSHLRPKYGVLNGSHCALSRCGKQDSLATSVRVL